MSSEQDTPDRVPVILAIKNILPCKVGVRLVCVIRARVVGDDPTGVVVAVGDFGERVLPLPAGHVSSGWDVAGTRERDRKKAVPYCGG